MRSLLALVPEVGPGSGPDLTRYFVVCACAILGLLGLAYVFRRFAARHLRAHAARRSLQVLDVLPLGGKQKLVVVRCYDRSFLLGLGEKEVRSIAELELELAPPASLEPAARAPGPLARFSTTLARELGARKPEPVQQRGTLKDGVVA